MLCSPCENESHGLYLYGAKNVVFCSSDISLPLSVTLFSPRVQIVVVRVVNTVDSAINASLVLGGWTCGDNTRVTAQELFDVNNDLSAVNPPGDPTHVSPRPGPPCMLSHGKMDYTFRPYSFTVITLSCP